MTEREDLPVAAPQFRRRRVPKGVGIFLQDPKARVASFIFGVVVFFAVFGPALAPSGENEQDLRASLEAPSWTHPMGTDQLGRDILSRSMYGSRVSVTVGLIVVAIAAGVALPIGLGAGYFGGWIDTILMRFVDTWISFPPFILILAIVAIAGTSLVNVMLAIGLASFPVFARLLRALTLSLKAQDFVLAARALGASDQRILARHLLPNTVQPLIVQGTLLVGVAVLAEAALSFLGVGVQRPQATWGNMIADGFPVIRSSVWPTILPGVLIMLFVLAANFMGDRLRDVLDPRLRGSR